MLQLIITKTRLYNFDPLKPHFYTVKLGFTGVYNIFLISAQNIDCGYLLEPPHRGGSNGYPQSIFLAEIWKISEFFIWKFSVFFGVKFSIYLNRHVFIMFKKGSCQFLAEECKHTGPSCSKLTTSLVNDSLKFTLSDTQIFWNFLLKKCE